MSKNRVRPKPLEKVVITSTKNKQEIKRERRLIKDVLLNYEDIEGILEDANSR